MAQTLLDKVWEAHTVRTLPSGQTQLLIGLHLIHEVTTPQAFDLMKDLKLKVRMPGRTFGTLDHIIPTTSQARPYADPMADKDGVVSLEYVAVAAIVCALVVLIFNGTGTTSLNGVLTNGFAKISNSISGA